MRRLFLVAACDEDAVKNVGKSLKRKVDIPGICQREGILLDRIIKKGSLRTDIAVNVWECKENKYSVWNQMFPGDSVLYYTKLNKESAFRFCGTVSCTIDSPELSAAIWGSPDFRYIHVCEDTPEIILNKEVVFGLLDYKLGRVQGFMKVSGKHLDRLSEFENVENMVEFLQEFESIDHHIDTKIGEEVSEKQLPNPGKRLKSIEKYYRDAQKRLEEGKIICQRKMPSEPPTQTKTRNTLNNVTGHTPSFSSINTVKENIGILGEEIVYTLEKAKLEEAGRHDLAEKIEIVSRKSNRYGYDIRSFDPEGNELHIEVKTTTKGKENPFEITFREMNQWETDRYFMIVRIFDLKVLPDEIMYDYYMLSQMEKEQIKAEPLVYRINIL